MKIKVHYLTLDTNTWIYLANGTEPARLLTFIQEQVEAGRIIILTPETVIQEWNKIKVKVATNDGLKHYNDVNEAFTKIQKLLGDKSDLDAMSFLLNEKPNKGSLAEIINIFKEKKTEIEAAISNNIKIIDALFNFKSTINITISESTILKAGKCSLEKKAPMKNRNSFADAIIVFSFIEYVINNGIKGALFISYNTQDFCERKDNKYSLHSDLQDDFILSSSKYYHIVGEAINTIKKNLISKEEMEFIAKRQEEAENHTDYCRACDGNNNCIIYGRPEQLFDERKHSFNAQQLQISLFSQYQKSENNAGNNWIEVGQCNSCNTIHFKCVECGTLNDVWEGEYNKSKECVGGCGLEYLIDTTGDIEGLGEGYIYRILSCFEMCRKCGRNFKDDGSKNNICIECENNYSYN